jgi:hypothetical protein
MNVEMLKTDQNHLKMLKLKNLFNYQLNQKENNKI